MGEEKKEEEKKCHVDNHLGEKETYILNNLDNIFSRKEGSGKKKIRNSTPPEGKYTTTFRTARQVQCVLQKENATMNAMIDIFVPAVL